MVNGIYLGGANNSVTLRDVTIGLNGANSQFGIFWQDKADGTSRSDVLTMNNVVIDGGWSSATGILWDGFANTVVGTSVRILHSNIGILIENSAHSTKYYPSFLNMFDLELEGFRTSALLIQGGSDFKIVGSDINNLRGGMGVKGVAAETDVQAVQILPDTGYSYTRDISIADTRIGDSGLSGVYADARNVQLNNDIFYSTSALNVGGAAVIRLGQASNGVVINNVTCEEFGGMGQASYCLQVDAGAQNILANGILAQYVRAGAVIDLGAISASYANVLEPNGKVLSW